MATPWAGLRHAAFAARSSVLSGVDVVCTPQFLCVAHPDGLFMYLLAAVACVTL
jgi:hypothetical protein